jgi:hypothetical protein
MVKQVCDVPEFNASVLKSKYPKVTTLHSVLEHEDDGKDFVIEFDVISITM